MKVVNAIDGISFIHFDERDVVRHKLVQQIVKAYEAFTNGNGRPSTAPTGSGQADSTGSGQAGSKRGALVEPRHG
jgi:hypothetical protein